MRKLRRQRSPGRRLQAIGRRDVTRGVRAGATRGGRLGRDAYEFVDWLEAAGVPLIDKEPRPGARGYIVVFLHPKAINGTLVELVERHPHGGK